MMLSKFADYKPRLKNQHRKQAPQFDVLVDRWWLEKSQGLAIGTLKSYTPCVARAVDVFGAYRMDEITPGHILSLLKDMQAGGFSQKTIENQHAVLNSIFDYFIAEYNADVNPSRQVSVPKSPKTKRQKKKRTRPTEFQRSMLLPAVSSSGGGLYLGFLFYTSCRKGEILALQYQDVDLDRRVISISKNITFAGNRPIVVNTKTENSDRENPILEPFYPYLEKALNARHKDTDFIFGGEQPITESRFEKMWLDTLEPLGLTDWTDGSGWKCGKKGQRHALVTSHQLRHEFSYSLYKAHVDVLQTKSLMGHADISTTYNIYTELGKEDMDRSAELLNEYFKSRDSGEISHQSGNLLMDK